MKYLLSISCIILSLHFPVAAQDTASEKSRSRLTIGGYGEAVYRYNFYSDNVFRYSRAESYKDSKGHGLVDLPHAVFMLGYDFGHGWRFGHSW